MLSPFKIINNASRKVYPLWLALPLCLWLPHVNAALCEAWEGDPEDLDGKIIGTVSVTARDIFNNALLAENHRVHRLANNLHYQTRRETIVHQLLFAEGDVFSKRVMNESERLLRSQGFLANADIRVLQVCDGKVWVRVETSDTWSTVPEVSLSRVAGENQRKISLEENNLFGRGQELAFSYEEDLDRVSRSLRYKHLDWAGKRRTLAFELQNNEDGERYHLAIGKPFHSLTGTQSWAAEGHFDRRSTSLYATGEISETMGMEQRYLDLNRSWSKGLHDDRLDRWTAGIRIDERRFYRVEDTVADAAFANRRERYPYIRLDHIKENFVELEHIRQLTGTEDINLGTQYSVEVGYGTRAWGATLDGLHLRFSYERGRLWKNRNLLLGESWYSTHIASGDLKHQRAGARGQLHTRISANDQFFFEVMFDSGHNLNPEEQLTIGGDSGLRGYPFRVQTGNRLLRLSSELRHYPDWNPWHLLRFGAALFVDWGAAWEAGGGRPERLWDVGVGLRLGSSRSSSGKVLHLDFAAPEGKGSPQWTATAKLHF